jgi:transposase-like protein
MDRGSYSTALVTPGKPAGGVGLARSPHRAAVSRCRPLRPEFREGAVRIVRETGKSIAQVARDLGINDGTLANWVKRDRERRGEAAAGQLSEDERAELARLRPSKGWSPRPNGAGVR